MDINKQQLQVLRRIAIANGEQVFQEKDGFR